MTLEYFITSSEMQDGLAALSRVHELVSVMEKEKDAVDIDITDASRQWVPVCSAIAATENKECLDLFTHLGGLLHIVKWLEYTLTHHHDTTASPEECIIVLLKAVSKLNIDKETSVSLGLWNNVNSLLDHSNSGIQECAKALNDVWNLSHRYEKTDADVLSGKPPSQNNNKIANISDIETSSVAESIDADRVDAKENPDSMQLKDDVDDPNHNLEAEEKLPVEAPSGGDDCCSAPRIDAPGDETDLGKEHGGLPDESGVSSKALNTGMEDFSPQKDQKFDTGNSPAVESENAEKSPVRYSDDVAGKICETADSCGSDPREESVCDEESLKTCEENGVGDHSSDADTPASDDSGHRKRNECAVDLKKYDSELDFGIVDALEVARQVAQEVERQVVDYKEPSCSSSSEKILKTGFRLPGSPESISAKIKVPDESATADVESGKNTQEIPEISADSFVRNQKPICVVDLNEEICSDESLESGKSNRRESFLDIDLNATEIDGERGGESATARPDKHSLDLNLDAFPAHSSSPASSLRNFDLNDRPSLPGENPEQHHLSSPVFSLFGAKLNVAASSKPPAISNGKSLQDVSFSRVGSAFGVPYGHTPYLGAPTMPVPSYMAPVPLPYQQPFLMAAPPFPLNGVAPPRAPSFDLNAGFAFDGAIRQLFIPARSVEEQYGGGGSQASSSSGMSAKRKEPESGWDPYSLQYKQPQPPWR